MALREIRTAMRLMIVLLFLGAVSLMASFSYGASVGGLDEAGLKLSVGAEHLNRGMRSNAGEVTLGTFPNTRLHGPNTIERVKMQFSRGEETIDRVYLRVAYGIERFGVFGKLGVAKHQTNLFAVTLSDQVENTAFFGSKTDVSNMGDLSGRGGYGILGGVGGQAYLKQENFRIGLKAEYLFHLSEADYVLSETGTVTVDPIGQTKSNILKVRVDETKTQEIQAAVILSVILKSLTSYYGGIKFSRIYTKYSGTSSRIERDDAALPPVVEQRDRFSFKTTSEGAVGFFVGAVYRIIPSVELNLELRAGDETGMTAQAGYQF